MQLQTPSRTRYHLLLAGTRIIACPVDEAYLRFHRARGGRLDTVQMCGALTGHRSRLESVVVAPEGAHLASAGTRSAPLPIARFVDGRGAPERGLHQLRQRRQVHFHGQISIPMSSSATWLPRSERAGAIAGVG